MDNTRFDPMRFSPRDLPSLEQLLREQSYQNRADVDLMSDYPRPDPPMQPYPAQGYYAPQQDPMMQSYAPYPYGAPQYGFAQPDPMQDNPYMDRGYVPGYPQSDPRAYMQTPYYGQHAREPQAPQHGYTPYDPDYRPQHMKPEPHYDAPVRYDDPRYGYAPQYGNGYPDPYSMPQPARMPQQPQDFRPAPPPRYAKQPAHEAQPLQQPAFDEDDYDALPSLAQLQQALEDERRAQDAMRAQEAMHAQESPRAQQAPRQPQSAPQPQQRPNPAPTAPEHRAAPQPSQRFVIEDLALDDDEEDHTKRKDPLEKTQFSSLLKRFRPKNS